MRMENSANSDNPSAKRFLVPVPVFEFDQIVFGRMIWDLAMHNLTDVLYLCVVENPDEELQALHSLSRLSAVTHDSKFRVETQVFYRMPWIKSIRRVWKPGDLILCLEDLYCRSKFVEYYPLVRAITTETEFPVHILPAIAMDSALEYKAAHWSFSLAAILPILARFLSGF